MGLTPFELKHWCARPIDPHELSAKLSLLQHNYAEVVQATPGSTDAQNLLQEHIGAIHPESNAHRAFGQLPSAAKNRPLLIAALSVPEDLCLLQRGNNGYTLIAGCVTAPSYWRLSDKLGKDLAAVHNNVPGLNDALGQRMADFFERLPLERCLLRRNWFFHGSSERFQPQPEHRTRITDATVAAKLTLRSETQTLRRLSDDVIAFTIAVDCYPLQEIESYPAAARALHRALLSRVAPEQLAASQSYYETGVLAFLERCFPVDSA